MLQCDRRCFPKSAHLHPAVSCTSKCHSACPSHVQHFFATFKFVSCLTPASTLGVENSVAWRSQMMDLPWEGLPELAFFGRSKTPLSGREKTPDTAIQPGFTSAYSTVCLQHFWKQTRTASCYGAHTSPPPVYFSPQPMPRAPLAALHLVLCKHCLYEFCLSPIRTSTRAPANKKRGTQKLSAPQTEN